jgi:hypothetical protein
MRTPDEQRPPFLATTAGGLALVVAMRLVFLARFGSDPGWMNDNFLAEAKAMRFDYPAQFVGMPLVRLLVFWLRDAGFGGGASLAILYFVSHLMLALGIFALARLVLAPTAHNRILTALAVAFVPVFAMDSGHQNISCTVGAGLLAVFAALQFTRTRGGGGEAARLAALFALSAAASCCRPEPLLGVAALTAAVLFIGPRIGARRAGAIAAGAGMVVGLLVIQLTSHATAERGFSSGSWAFYNFYDRKPYLVRLAVWIMNPHAGGSEYARYADSVKVFGSYAENGGSLLRALLRRPVQAVLWIAAKPVDGVITTLRLDAFTPLGAIAIVAMVRRIRRDGRRAAGAHWLPLLCAYGAPTLFSLFFSQGLAQYMLIASPLLLFAMLWGIEPWVARLQPRAAMRLAATAALASAVAVVIGGHPGRASSPVLRDAAAWLQQRCARQGCLVNALPAPIDVQAWADLQAGAPLPGKDKRAEEFVLHQYSPGFIEQVRWSHRRAEARRRGFTGPVFYVRPQTSSLKCFNDDFDPEHALEGTPDDLSTATLAASFSDRDDRVEIFELRSDPG